VAVSTTRQRRSWYVYDWANSAFQTTVVTVFLGPYLTGVADAAAGADGFLHPLGVPIRASAYYPYLVAASAVLQVLTMPVVGALADRTGRRRELLGATAHLGAVATMAREQRPRQRLGPAEHQADRRGETGEGQDAARREDEGGPQHGHPHHRWCPTAARPRTSRCTKISDKGTSWLGPLTFGLALQVTGSYRVAIVSLVVFFVAGFVLLASTDVRRAAAEAAAG